MVSLLEMPQPTLTTTASPTTTPAPAPVIERGLIEIEQLDFAYGNHHVLHDVNLRIQPRAVSAASPR